MRVGASSLSVAEPGIWEQLQMSRVAAEQFGTLPEINCDRAVPPAGNGAGCLRWRHQLTSKPGVCSGGSHRINRFGHIWAGMMAGGALQHRDFETRGAGGNPHRRRCGLARWTYWRELDEHDWTP